MKRKFGYPAAKIPDEIKSNLARLYIIRHAKEKPRYEFVNELSEAGLQVSERQIDRWVARLNSNTQAISMVKQTGGLAVLSREERDIASGWVLHEISHGRAVHLKSLCDFVTENLSVQISTTTAFNYLTEDGFSSKTLQKKSASFEVDVEKLESDLWSWVSAHQNDFKNLPLSKLASIDFTYTGHRTDHRVGYGIKGGPQPMESVKISKYTNCIITCVWNDGINRTPPILYTHNQNFRLDRNKTERRDAQEAHFQECAERHKIDQSRVVYIGKLKNETEQYAKECPALLRLFFEHHGIEPDAAILSDN